MIALFCFVSLKSIEVIAQSRVESSHRMNGTLMNEPTPSLFGNQYISIVIVVVRCLSQFFVVPTICTVNGNYVLK